MAESAQDQAARDDAHLRSLGIKPELRRTLGFLSNFAIAFSFISVSTGSYGNFGVGIGQAGPAFFWSWPIVIIGQLIVALVFAELASHFPVAGSIYQWSKRLSNRTLGWFTGWFYFWAQVVTVRRWPSSSRYVIAGIHRRRPGRSSTRRRRLGARRRCTRSSPSPRCVITTLINAFGVRLLSILNNIGVATEILGHARLRADPAVLRQQPVARRSCFDTAGTEAATERQLPRDVRARHVHVDLHRVRLRHGRDVRRGDARREPPGAARRHLSSVVDLGHHRDRSSCSRSSSRSPTSRHDRRGLAGGFPIADTSRPTSTQELVAGITVGEIYLFVILASVFVCTLAIQGAATRMMFSMSRDRHLPARRRPGATSTRASRRRPTRPSRSASSPRSRSS